MGAPLLKMLELQWHKVHSTMVSTRASTRKATSKSKAWTIAKAKAAYVMAQDPNDKAKAAAKLIKLGVLTEEQPKAPENGKHEEIAQHEADAQEDNNEVPFEKDEEVPLGEDDEAKGGMIADLVLSLASAAIVWFILS